MGRSKSGQGRRDRRRRPRYLPGSTGHLGSKRGLWRFQAKAGPDGKPLLTNGKYTIVWPARKRARQVSGLCTKHGRRMRARFSPRREVWICRSCGWEVSEIRRDKPGPMAADTRRQHYLDKTGSSGLTCPQRRRYDKKLLRALAKAK